MIELEKIVATLCESPGGSWDAQPYRSAWEVLQIAARDEPTNALAVIAVLAGCLSDPGLAKLASKPLRHIIDEATPATARIIQQYRSEDQRVGALIEAVERYSAKVQALRSALTSKKAAPPPPRTNSIRLVNPYSTTNEIDDCDPAGQPPTAKDDLFDFYDVAVSERPRYAWSITDAVAARAESDRDRLIVAQALSMLLNLHEPLVRSDLVERARHSRPLRAVLAHCRFAISEDLLDQLLLALAPAHVQT